MFNNKKNDPLIDSVKAVMEQNELFRQIEQELLEEYGVVSRKALPHEIQPEFDAVLAEAKKCAMEELKGDQHKIDVAHPKGKLTKADFDKLRNMEEGLYKDKLDSAFAKSGVLGNWDWNANGGRGDFSKKGKSELTPGEKIAYNVDTTVRKVKEKAVKPIKNAIKKLTKEESDEDTQGFEKGHVVKVVKGDKASPHPHIVREVGSNTLTVQVMHGPKVTGNTFGVPKSHVSKPIQKINIGESEQLDETSPRKAKKYIQRAADDLADKTDPQYGYITDKDEDEISRAVENRRKGIRRALKKMEESEQLDEKAVSKAQHRFFGLVRGIQKGQAKGSKKAKKAAKQMTVKQVRDFAKTKEKGLPEKVDEDIDSIMEEIRNNLEEQLIAVYESGDEDAFTDFVDSLTEEQAEILGLMERDIGTTPGGAAVTDTRGSSISYRRGYGVDQKTQAPAAPKSSALGSPSAVGIDKGRGAGFERAPNFLRNPKERTTSSGFQAQPTLGSNKNTTPGGGGGSTPSAVGVPPATNQPAPRTVGRGGGGRAQADSMRAQRTAPAPTTTPAKSQAKPTTRPVTKPAATRPSPRPKARPAPSRKFGFGSAGGSDPSSALGATARALGSVNEQKETVLKESFEHFIRNKFLKD